MNILAFESSCDETAAAVVRDGRTVLSDVIASQADMHAVYGGVVPEIASRKHVEAIAGLADQALARAGLTRADIDAVAVTYAPGLIGALLVGVNFAKAAAYGLGVPLIPVHHVRGHIAANYITHPELEPPFVCLCVSGGNTMLVDVRDYTDMAILGATRDDAAGECFDKVARLLGFPYPGGPHIDRHGQNGDPHAIKVPMGLTQGKAGAAHPYDFSFSGVKTAVARWVESEQAAGHEIPVDDVCASLADSVATVLARKAMRGCRQYDSNTLIVGGGFSANSQLRAKLLEFGENYGVDVRIPQIKLCTDNGAMVAMLGVNLVEAGVAPSAPDFPIDSAMPLTKVSM